MHESAELRYLASVDKTLSELRDRLLGLEMKFPTLLPKDLLREPCETRAEHLADRLLFCLASQDICSAATLQKAREWMYLTFLYLLRECKFSDQTFVNFLKICYLESGARRILFDDAKIEWRHLIGGNCCPVKKEQMEQAILTLLSCSSANRANELLYKQIQQTMRSHPAS